MRLIEKIGKTEEIRVTTEQRNAFGDWWKIELEDAMSSRHFQDQMWVEAQRLYNSVPRRRRRDVPIPNAPNQVVGLASIASDSIWAQILDLVFQVVPTITVRAVRSEWVEHAKALQDWVNHSIQARWCMRDGVEDALLDDVQLGTGVFYIPFIERIKRTRQYKVLEQSPRILAVAVEDFFVPGGVGRDVDVMQWCSVRHWLTELELKDRAKLRGWDIKGVHSAGGKGFVRSARETMGRTNDQKQKRSGSLYEIHDVFCRYDIDGDGVEEDLYAVIDRTSGSVLFVDYTPYEWRPFTSMVYQRRAHLFYGIGVPEAIRQEQEAATETLNYWLLNMILANARGIVSRTGSLPPDFKIWPFKNIETPNPEDVVPFALADVYQSGPQALSMILGLSERKTGINELSTPRPSQILGSRTPATTAGLLAQQSSRRFTGAFDSARLAIGSAVKHCLFREQEQLISGNSQLVGEMNRVLGEEKAEMVLELMTDERFDEQAEVELTASSATINKEADKQNSILLLDRMSVYYQRVLELAQIAAAPETPDNVREIAKQIVEKGNEIVERTLRTFDSIRDPEQFLIEVSDELDADVGPVPPQAGAELIQSLIGLGGGDAAGAVGGFGEGAGLGGEPEAQG